MEATLSLIISLISLIISGITVYLTLFRRGTIKMTQPTVIFFGPDPNISKSETPLPKVFLRTLLFSTSKRGRVIESMYIALSRNETRQNFNIWVYGDKELVRGSGLYVGETGISSNHHFLTPKDGSSFKFIEGEYRLDVFASLYGDRKQRHLFSQKLYVSHDIANQISEPNTGLYFDWGSDSSGYLPHVEKR